MIFFSIILPTFNDLENLKNSIKSVDRQTFKSFELIVVNDGSTDKTKEYLKKLTYSFIKIVNLSNNKGPAYARNKAIENSSGKWLCFLDSDDFWFENKLEIMRQSIEASQIDKKHIYCHNLILKDKKLKNKKRLISGPIQFSKEYENLLKIGNKLLLSATCVNNEFIRENKIRFNEKRKYVSVEDYDFWLILSLNGAKFGFINKFLGIYLKHEKNLTNNILLHKKNLLYVIHYHVFQLQKFDKKKIKLWKKLHSKHIIELIFIYFLRFQKYKIGCYLIYKYYKRYNIIFISEFFNFIIRKLKN